MSVQIILNSNGKQHLITAVPKDSILKCDSVSAPDVYVAGSAGATHDLSPGDSMLVPAGTLTLFLFRRAADGSPYSAQLELNPVTP